MSSASELVREAFLATAAEARGLIASREVAAKWREPSALELLDVGSVAGHLARAGFVVIGYLDATDPALGVSIDASELLTADQYFERLLAGAAGSTDDLNAGVRARAAEEAAAGQEALVARVDATLQALDERLASEPADRVVAVAGGITMPLDEYLVTRMIELVAHSSGLVNGGYVWLHKKA